MKPKRKGKVGLPPGSVVFTGDKKIEKVQIHYLQYDVTALSEAELDNHGQILFHTSPINKVDWYDIRGLHDTKLIEEIGKTFHIHPLALEDVADTFQRPKFEDYENGLFIIFKALSYDKATKSIQKEQVAIYFYQGFLVSFQETESDLFEAIRTRLRGKSGKIRQRGSDYLAYALCDVVVDRYLMLLDEIGADIEILEDQMLEDQKAENKAEIHHLKKEILKVRKAIFPLREAIMRFSKCENEVVDAATIVFVRDLYDHIIQVLDTVESLRDLLMSLYDLFISEVSFKMNQVMQILTLVSTLFIPLTFLAGIYGMNFANMPELQWKYGYFILLTIMFLMAFALLRYFKNKKWM